MTETDVKQDGDGLSVDTLRAVLDRLKPTDWVTVNRVRNLAVFSVGGLQIGHVQLRRRFDGDPGQALERYDEDRT